MAATPAPAAGQMSVSPSVKPPMEYRRIGRSRNSISTRVTPRTSIQFTMLAIRKSQSRLLSSAMARSGSWPSPVTGSVRASSIPAASSCFSARALIIFRFSGL